MSQNLLSAAVVIGALRANSRRHYRQHYLTGGEKLNLNPYETGTTVIPGFR